MSKNKTSTITRNPQQLVIERIPMTPETPAQAVAPVKNIYQRMNQVMQEVDYIQKRDLNSGMKYLYASHDAVTGLLHDPITKAGIFILPEVQFYGKENDVVVMKLRIEFINIDSPEDKITMNFTVPTAARQETNEKTFGATYSYACKYAMLKVFLLETGTDVDNTEYLSASEVEFIYENASKETIQNILADYKKKKLSEIPADYYSAIKKRVSNRKLNQKEINWIFDKIGTDSEKLTRILDFYKVATLADIDFDKFATIAARLEAKKVEVPSEIT